MQWEPEPYSCDEIYDAKRFLTENFEKKDYQAAESYTDTLLFTKPVDVGLVSFDTFNWEIGQCEITEMFDAYLVISMNFFGLYHIECTATSVQELWDILSDIIDILDGLEVCEIDSYQQPLNPRIPEWRDSMPDYATEVGMNEVD